MEKTEKKTAEETIYEMVGIKPGADKLTPMDYGEAKACMEMFAAQELAEYKVRLKEAISEDYKVTMLRSQGLRTVINVDSVYQLIDKL